jgi:virginiamycin A acetyltransferase
MTDRARRTNMIRSSETVSTELITSLAGRALTRLYKRVPLRTQLLRMITAREGGQLRSASLRQILVKFHGVEVGAHSYGSLLAPGMCDKLTTIGRYVSVGPGVRRFGAAHPLQDATLHPYWYNPQLGRVPASKDVHRSSLAIESEVWIGANALILPNCHRIGFGAVIGAGSVVTKDVDDFAVVVGNPARQVSMRLTPELRDRLMANHPWELPPAEYEKRRDEIVQKSTAR